LCTHTNSTDGLGVGESLTFGSFRGS
jgi:hypothetical protein